MNKSKRNVDVSPIFDLVDEGPRTNIAREKDQMVGEAVWKGYQRKILGRSVGRKQQIKPSS